jgi:hypothetical protein
MKWHDEFALWTIVKTYHPKVGGLSRIIGDVEDGERGRLFESIVGKRWQGHDRVMKGKRMRI